MLASDCFGDPDLSIGEELGCFFISISPGIAIILLNYLLRKQELILGIILVVTAIFFLFFFQYYKNIAEHILTILTIVFPPLICGIIFIISRNRY